MRRPLARPDRRWVTRRVQHRDVGRDAASLETAMREFVETRDLKLGAIIHAVRIAATGKPVGFGMFEALELLGPAGTLARIDRTLARL